ncbi:hypothetical protein PC9H_010697 [Pleurotus ostreatus]|uniref:Uncharacterized protein n=1 Tax=Pleurotus ostreatus TaxID=5322 RepID=A0A8H6ZNB0_PLEOS|nr:uncharacterized protein PC9H_010697 [Pleurotus ostreatus]KAF7422541.1 hypothetical protein PC9H_010697 [Pleurotus ostreatus]
MANAPIFLPTSGTVALAPVLNPRAVCSDKTAPRYHSSVMFDVNGNAASLRVAQTEGRPLFRSAVASGQDLDAAWVNSSGKFTARTFQPSSSRTYTFQTPSPLSHTYN